MMRIFLFILLLLNSVFSFGSDDQGFPIIRNFKEYDYQGGSKIYSILSTKKGILYAGDKTGIIEFDGETWNKINCGFTVNSMIADTSGMVYVAGNQGIGRLVTDSSNVISFQSLNHFLSKEDGFRKFRYSKVFNINNNIVFVLGNEIVINTPERIRIIESPYRFRYYQKLNNILYLYSPSDGLYKLEDNKLQIVSNSKDILRNDVRGFYSIDNRLLMITNDNGIIQFDNDKISFVKNELTSYISLMEVQGIEQLDDTTYALKTFYSGISIFNQKQFITHSYRYENGLANNTVLSVFKDHWSNLWVGTAGGISTIRLDFPFKIYNSRKGIGTGYSAKLYKDEMYFATSQGLYKKELDLSGKRDFKEIFRGHVWGMNKVGDYLYFGQASGLYAWDNKQIRKITNIPSGWLIKKIPFEANLYLTNTPFGLLLMELKDDGILKSIDFIKGTESYIRNFEFDSINNIWAEFPNGILKFNLSANNLKAENIRKFDRVESGNKLKKLRKIGSELHFVADSGVYTFNSELNKYEQSELFYDLFYERVIPSNIIVDPYDRIWIFGEGKLTFYKILDKKLKKASSHEFDYSDNSYPQDYENIFCINENITVVGREQGFLCFDKSIKSKGTYSSTIIRKIQLFSKRGNLQTIWGNEDFSDQNQNIQIVDKIRYKNNSIKFYFSAGCSNYDNVEYQTHLVGYDNKWTNWSNESIKEFTNLPPGDYQFIIRSLNKGSEYSYVANCKFTIDNPWYLTTIAKVIYACLLLLLIYLIERINKLRAKNIQAKIKKREEEKQYRNEQERIQEDLKKEKEIVRLRNEKLRIDNLYKSKELANSTMNIINKNQFLTEIKAELELIKEYTEKNKIVTEDVRKVIIKINRDIDNEENWKVFEDYFDKVHENFFSKMKQKFPILSSKDLRLSSYIRMNLSTKEIAPLMNIAVRGVEISRYRLRKKLGLNREDNLNDFLLKL